MAGLIHRIGALFIAVAAVSLLWGAVQADAQTAPQAPGQVSLSDIRHDPVNGRIHATLSGSGATPLNGLRAYLDGSEIDVTVLGGEGAAPRAVAIVIEGSVSMAGGRLATAQSAAHAVLDALATGDQAALVVFDTEPRVVVPMTAELARVRTAIDEIALAGGSDLFGGVEAASSLLAQTPQGSRAMTVVAYGWNWGGTSGVTREASLAAAEASGASVYPLVLGSDYDSAFLTDLAALGDGVFRTGAQASELPPAVAGERATAVELELAVPALSRGTHELQVELGAGSAVARAPFEVTNEGLVMATVESGATLGDPILLQVISAAPEGLALSATASGREIAVAADGMFLLDPWEFEPGTLDVSVLATAADGVAWSETVSVAIPALEPELAASFQQVAGEDQLLVEWRVQPGQHAVLAVSIDGAPVVGTEERRVAVAVEPGAQLSVRLLDADGAVLTSQELAAPGASGGGLSLPLVPLLAVAGLTIVLALAVLISRGRISIPKPAPRDPHRRDAAPGRGDLGAGGTPLTQEATAAGTAMQASGPAARIVARGPHREVHEVEFVEGPISIGSSPQCDLTLRGNDVRFVHVVMDVMKDGVFRLHFFGPMDPADAGPDVEQRIASRETRRRPGETFRVGAYTVHIEQMGAQQQDDSTRQGSAAA